MSKPSRIDELGNKYYLLMKKNNKWTFKTQSFVIYKNHDEDATMGQFISSLWFNEEYNRNKVMEYYIICVNEKCDISELLSNINQDEEYSLNTQKGVVKYEYFRNILYLTNKLHDDLVYKNISKDMVLNGRYNSNNTLKFSMIKYKKEETIYANKECDNKNEFTVNYYNPSFKLSL
tara:strand:- start:1749 stop:2276 length:528 start_codon:yes stop_codon:yes gene_type:complete